MYWQVTGYIKKPDLSAGQINAGGPANSRAVFGNRSLRCPRSLLQTRPCQFHPWNRTSCISTVVARQSASQLHPCGIANSRVTLTRNSGFTLMELLVVIVIISISFSLFMTINFSFSNPADAIRKEAVKLQRLLEFSHEQSVVRAEEYGLRLNESRYRFMRLDDLSGKWVEIDKDKLMRERELPENMSFELSIEDVDVVLQQEDGDTEDPDVEIRPQIFLLSSGELTPDFRLHLRLSGFDHVFELHGDTNGRYELRDISDE